MRGNDVTNDEVLRLAKADYIEFLLNNNRLCWLGHVARMQATKELPLLYGFSFKAFLFGELAKGKNRTDSKIPSKIFSKEVKFLILGQKVQKIYLNGAN